MIEIRLAISKEFLCTLISVVLVILFISGIVVSIQDKDWFGLLIFISMGITMICAVMKSMPV